jgi:2-succinyl-5-enolpyruvyl-6-hydroxy-3-cyclohexene-1-carboxylate synthase
VLAHRGVNGIDGVVSSALGASVAIDAPLLLVTGDLSLHHDLTGLWAAREGRTRVTILLVQNDGGGIFSFLPIARHGEAFERYFGTPHGIDFEPAVSGYGISFERAADAADARTRVLRSLVSGGTRVIELRSERARSHDAHQAVWREAIHAVESLA